MYRILRNSFAVHAGQHEQIKSNRSHSKLETATDANRPRECLPKSGTHRSIPCGLSSEADGTTLPGYRKKSFAMAFGGGEIWIEHLDGLYGYTELAIQKLAQDWLVLKRPSSPALLAINLNETKPDDRLLEEIANRLLGLDKRLLRVVFVGVSRAVTRKLKKALRGAAFSLGFENDFEKAKQWLVRVKA